MNRNTSFVDRILRAFQPSPRGIVGVVEDLLDECRDRQVALDYHDTHCRVRSLDAGHEAIDVPLPKSAFRAVLARVAALCNENATDAVAPYSGHATLPFPGDPAAAYHVSFTNSPAEQRLELRYVSRAPDGGVHTAAATA